MRSWTLEKIKGVVMIAFIVWLVILGIGLVTIVVKPESLALAGQFGDMFGFFNSIASMVTMGFAIWTLHSQSEQLNAQRLLAEQQKIHEVRGMLREKLETVMIGLRRYIEICLSEAAVGDEQIEISWNNSYVVSRSTALAVPEILLGLHFPAFKAELHLLQEADSAISDYLRQYVHVTDQDEREFHFCAFQILVISATWEYQKMFAKIMNNGEAIIASSPHLANTRQTN
ncbi:hypothetical protein WJU23_05300 [Prosthecobacter sp. SYSU 5D2]|uniref:hypothetical protein n=1 Tax=Prosthecobacter sp. SYSU 5D2 TaxID=3134134 RepID=UPI0031FE7BD1